MISPNAGRVLNIYRAATDEQRMEGIDWYRNAHGAAASLDPRNVERAAGVIAALSPRTRWEHNLELAAATYVRGKASGTLGMSCRAADAIFAGAHPLDVLKGPKVRAFYTLISDPDDDRTVCVDRHAIDIALGTRLDDTDRSTTYALDRGGLYEKFAACYRRAAVRLGVTPARVQAVTWVTWRTMMAG